MYNVVCNVLVGIRFQQVIGFYSSTFKDYLKSPAKYYSSSGSSNMVSNATALSGSDP
jgi:hypothetical protein